MGSCEPAGSTIAGVSEEVTGVTGTVLASFGVSCSVALMSTSFGRSAALAVEKAVASSSAPCELVGEMVIPLSSELRGDMETGFVSGVLDSVTSSDGKDWRAICADAISFTWGKISDKSWCAS